MNKNILQPETVLTVRLECGSVEYVHMPTVDAMKPNGIIDKLNSQFGSSWVRVEWKYITPYSPRPADYGGVHFNFSR